MTLEEMLAMPLHSFGETRGVMFQRVPGGWIYTSAVFVPEPWIPPKAADAEKDAGGRGGKGVGV